MLPTFDVLKYMIARRVEGTEFIRAAFDDPVLLQAELDGYAVREDGQWRGLGYIEKGEHRTLRYLEGGIEEIIGK